MPTSERSLVDSAGIQLAHRDSIRRESKLNAALLSAKAVAIFNLLLTGIC